MNTDIIRTRSFIIPIGYLLRSNLFQNTPHRVEIELLKAGSISGSIWSKPDPSTNPGDTQCQISTTRENDNRERWGRQILEGGGTA